MVLIGQVGRHQFSVDDVIDLTDKVHHGVGSAGEIPLAAVKALHQRIACKYPSECFTEKWQTYTKTTPCFSAPLEDAVHTPAALDLVRSPVKPFLEGQL